MNTPNQQRWWDRSARGLVRILLCLLVYLAAVVSDYWLVDTNKITVRSAITFAVIFTFIAFLLALIVAFKPRSESTRP